MTDELKGKRVAILATEGVEQVELLDPAKALEAAGAQVEVISPQGGQFQGYNGHEKGDMIRVDRKLDAARPEHYEALVLPGGVMNPDTLRAMPEAVAFVRHFVQSKKPIAAICHGPWTLIDAEGVRGKRMTSWPSLQMDLRNAGATWVDEPVVADMGLVTSRRPDDLPQFCSKIIEEIREGGHDRPRRQAAE
jgi:protease I